MGQCKSSVSRRRGKSEVLKTESRTITKVPGTFSFDVKKIVVGAARWELKSSTLSGGVVSSTPRKLGRYPGVAPIHRKAVGDKGGACISFRSSGKAGGGVFGLVAGGWGSITAISNWPARLAGRPRDVSPFLQQRQTAAVTII